MMQEILDEDDDNYYDETRPHNVNVNILFLPDGQIMHTTYSVELLNFMSLLKRFGFTVPFASEQYEEWKR